MANVAAEQCAAFGATREQFESHPVRDVTLGTIHVQRALPVRERRLVGPWCFLDRFGPLSFGEGTPMDVAPHPHMGLQTVTWLLQGEIVHDDSLGNEGALQPGAVNIMTAGHAIAHAERTPARNSGHLSGVQLWTALPDRDRNGPASFQHVAQVPVGESAGGVVRVFSGGLGDHVSAATHFSEIVGADLQVHKNGTLAIPLQRAHEHAVLVLEGDCVLEGQPMRRDQLYYLGTQRTDLTMTSTEGARVLLVGGLPFSETILMWWNFVARTPDEILAARSDWAEHRRFGEVVAYNGPRLEAPEVTRLAQPNPVS
jgi:redox-sensitive bicupin YhaK (pirin superfamily)